MIANRDFLIGMLAVQAGLIDSDRMHEILSQLREDAGIGFLDVLRQTSSITDSQELDLENQAARLLGPQRPPSAAKKLDPDASDVASTPGSTEETIESHPEKDSTPDSEDTMSIGPGRRDAYEEIETVQTNPISRNRYTLTREHGRGGLGCVWLARDSILNREVALKEVLPAKSQNKSRDQSQSKKLVREAQITGQLEHPNIVPVYELSPGGQERPFYTMRFLRGETLTRHIREYRRRKRMGESGTLELRRLLNAFVSVCHAVGYAHSRNIIHRDLKPSNVMLGDFGEVIVVDWGLAKKLSEPRDKDVDMESVHYAGEESRTHTADGQALGTPAFMAPEQARGQISLTDQLTDIYGLGSILFAILTGKAPHATTKPQNEKDSTIQLLRRVCTQPTPTVHSVEPDVPRALNAICSKAMAHARSERYTTAEELAEDVQRWLADEPVSVYEDRLLEKTMRWLRHHRTFTLAAASILLILSVSGIVVATVNNRAKNRVAVSLENEQASHRAAVAALDSEQAAKAQALQQFRRAQDAIDRSLSGASDLMSNFPGTAPMRTQLLRTAADDYQELLAVDDSDPELRREAARTRLRLADVYRELSEIDAAEEQYLLAEQEFQQMQLELPEDESWSIDLATTWSKLSLLHTLVGENEDAQTRFDQAIEAYDKSYRKPEFSFLAQRESSKARLNSAILLRAIGNHTEAIELLTAADDQLQQLLSEKEDSEIRQQLAMAQRLLGLELHSVGQDRAAIEKLSDAETQYKRLLAIDPEDAAYLEGLANARGILASARRAMSDDFLTLQTYQEAINDYVVLLKVRPGIPDNLRSLSALRVNVAQVLYKLGRSRDAHVHVQEALRELIDLSNTYSQVIEYRSAHAGCLIMMGMVLRDLNDKELTETALREGVAEFQYLHDEYPDLVGYRGDVAVSRMKWARLLEKRGDIDQAAIEYQDLIQELNSIVEEADESVRFRNSLAFCHQYLGDLLSRQNKTAAAKLHVQTALDLRQQLPDLPELRRALILLLVHGSVQELTDPTRAVELARELSQQSPQNPDFRYTLAYALLAEGDAEAARDEAKLAAELRTLESPFDLFVLAIAQRECGDADAAAATLQQAQQLTDEQCPGRIELNALRQRAEALISQSD